MPLTEDQKRWQKRYRASEKGQRTSAAYMRRRRGTPEGKVEAARIRRKSHLKRTYGLTLEDYDAAVVAQDGKCAICGADGQLYVDHDHVSGRVRKLLCFTCNAGLGLFKEDPRLLRLAAKYLEAEDSVRS